MMFIARTLIPFFNIFLIASMVRNKLNPFDHGWGTVITMVFIVLSFGMVLIQNRKMSKEIEEAEEDAKYNSFVRGEI